MKYIIVDLDNCISDDGWRINKIKLDEKDPFIKYHEYHSLCEQDELKHGSLLRDPDYRTIIFTARPVKYSRETLNWLQKHGIRPHLIMMRPNADHNPSVNLKESMLLHIFMIGIKKEEIGLCVDDRQDIVDMYRKYGLKANRVYIHNIDTESKKETSAKILKINDDVKIKENRPDKDKKVIPFGGITRLHLHPDQLLDKAKGMMKHVLLVGENNDGGLYFASSMPDGGDVLWFLEQAKKLLLEVEV